MDLGKYGFRHDPVAWALQTDSLDAAWVRTTVLEQPRPGDGALLAAAIDDILAERGDDGTWGDETAGKLMRLLDLGCPPTRPEFQQALTVLHDRCVAENGCLEAYTLMLCGRAGWPDATELAGATAKWQEKVDELNFWSGCPWTGEVHLQVLWANRAHADVMPTIDHGLTMMRDNVKGERRWPLYLDPYGWLECVGVIDHPRCREIVARLVPMILRTQAADGSWGDDWHLGYGPGSRTLAIMRALKKWGLLEPLREKPPLPAEWRLERTIPAPPGSLKTMTWDGTRLWVYDSTAGEAVAIALDDGRRLHAVKLPDNIGGIAWADGALLATRQEPETVFVIDPDTGAIRQQITPDAWGLFSAIAKLDERVCIGNVYCGGVHFLTGGELSHTRWLAGGFVVDMACVDGTIWHIDMANQLLIRSDPSKTDILLDWAGAPFGADTTGLAAIGADLWALDCRNHTISQIERLPLP